MVNLGQIFLSQELAYIVENIFDVDIRHTNSVIWCKIKTTAIQSFHMIFLSAVCSAAFDQFLSTNYSYSLRQLSTKNLAKKIILCNCSLMILHMIVALIFYEIRPQYLGCTIYNSIIANYYTFFFYPFLIGILPVMVTVIFSLIAFYNVRHLVRRQIPTNRREFDRQLTAMTFARVIAYITFGLPYIIFRIYSVKTPIQTGDSQLFAINFLIGSMAGSWAYINYVVRCMLLSLYII